MHCVQVLFPRAAQHQDQLRLSAAEFVAWWSGRGLVGADGDTCVYEVMRQPHADFLTQGDLTQFMQFVLQHHPGLEFLQVCLQPDV